jgi:hypothetical protein
VSQYGFREAPTQQFVRLIVHSEYKAAKGPNGIGEVVFELRARSTSFWLSFVSANKWNDSREQATPVLFLVTLLCVKIGPKLLLADAEGWREPYEQPARTWIVRSSSEGIKQIVEGSMYLALAYFLNNDTQSVMPLSVCRVC